MTNRPRRRALDDAVGKSGPRTTCEPLTRSTQTNPSCRTCSRFCGRVHGTVLLNDGERHGVAGRAGDSSPGGSAAASAVPNLSQEISPRAQARKEERVPPRAVGEDVIADVALRLRAEPADHGDPEGLDVDQPPSGCL